MVYMDSLNYNKCTVIWNTNRFLLLLFSFSFLLLNLLVPIFYLYLLVLDIQILCENSNFSHLSRYDRCILHGNLAGAPFLADRLMASILPEERLLVLRVSGEPI